MPSDRTRIILIFAVVAAVVGGAGYWFFGVFRPAQVRDAAQAEIVAWEAKWKPARLCLLGGDGGVASIPAAAATANATETLAIAALLTPGDGAGRHCLELIGGLARESATDTGLPAVEAAWEVLEHAVSKFAAAYATHVDPSGERHAVDDPLGTAIDAVDAAHASLRAAAKLTIENAAATHLPAATMIELSEGGEPVITFDPPIVTSGHGVVGFARTKTADVQIDLVPGAAPKLSRVADGVERGVPDASWGALGTTAQIQIGAFAADGTFSTTPPPTTLPVVGTVEVLAAVGSATDGSVAFRVIPPTTITGRSLHPPPAGLIVAHATAGAFVAGAPILSDRVVFATDAATGTTAFVWNDHAGALHGMFVSPATGATAAIDLGADLPDALCVTGDRAWLRTTRAAMIQFGATGAPSAPIALADHALRGCTPDGAIFEDRHAVNAYALCGATCRPIKVSHPDVPVVTTTLADKLITFGARGGVLAIWPETGAPRFVSVPTSFILLSATTDGKVFDVLGRTATTLAIARFPVH